VVFRGSVHEAVSLQGADQLAIMFDGPNVWGFGDTAFAVVGGDVLQKLWMRFDLD
jgi:hypothetical protein